MCETDIFLPLMNLKRNVLSEYLTSCIAFCLEHFIAQYIVEADSVLTVSWSVDLSLPVNTRARR